MIELEVFSQLNKWHYFMSALNEVSTKTGIPTQELKRLLALPYRDGMLPTPIAKKNIGFANKTIKALRNELDNELKQGRKDFQKTVNSAFNLILGNLVVCVFSKHRLSLSGSEKFYNKGKYLNSLFLTFRAVHAVTDALMKKGLITFKKGSKAKKQVNSYKPTKKLELLLLPLIYEVQEEYIGDEKSLVIFKPADDSIKESETKGKPKNHKLLVHSPTKNYIMRRRSHSPDLPSDHPDRVGLKRINEYLKDVTFALKSPVKRIFSHNDPMQGGRLYVRIQGLPDRRARIRVNTLLNGLPVAEVDLSANHPRMILALQNKKLPANFYDDIAAKTKTTREQVKFLVTRAIGATGRKVNTRKLSPDNKKWLESDFVITKEEKKIIEAAIQEISPDLFKHLYTGMGIYLQGLEGDILMGAMLDLIEQDIPSLPIHDAIYVQRRHKTQAKKALEKSWMEVLGVKFKPAIKIDSA
jgi:hypothetical protein